MESKNCTQSKTDKHIGDFYNKYSENKARNIKKGVNRCYEKKDKISIQKNIL